MVFAVDFVEQVFLTLRPSFSSKKFLMFLLLVSLNARGCMCIVPGFVPVMENLESRVFI